MLSTPTRNTELHPLHVPDIEDADLPFVADDEPILVTHNRDVMLLEEFPNRTGQGLDQRAIVDENGDRGQGSHPGFDLDDPVSEPRACSRVSNRGWLRAISTFAAS